MDTIKDSRRLPRRRHDAALKAQVLAECGDPEASVARVAQAHGLNANLVHKWRRMAAAPAVVSPGAPLAHAFIPLSLAPSQAAPAPPAEELIIELRRGALAVKATWPVTAAADCAIWMRELLR